MISPQRQSKYTTDWQGTERAIRCALTNRLLFFTITYIIMVYISQILHNYLKDISFTSRRKNHKMNINQLRYFASVARHHSFSRAAQENFITQTAMTQQIRLLEEQMETVLIDRSCRPIALTPAGEVFYKEVRLILERMDYAIKQTKEASNGTTGSLKIGYTKGYERSDLSNRLRFFHQQYPSVLISCFRNSSDVLAAELLSGQVDLIFSWDSTGLCSDSAVMHRQIEDAPLMAALYASHPLARRESVRREDLKGEPIFFMSPSAAPGSVGDAAFLQLYQRAGYTPHILMNSSDAESILLMVAAEQGISILPNYFTKKLEHADNLIFLPMEGPDEYERICAFYCKDNPNPALAAYLDFAAWEDR